MKTFIVAHRYTSVINFCRANNIQPKEVRYILPCRLYMLRGIRDEALLIRLRYWNKGWNPDEIIELENLCQKKKLHSYRL